MVDRFFLSAVLTSEAWRHPPPRLWTTVAKNVDGIPAEHAVQFSTTPKSGDAKPRQKFQVERLSQLQHQASQNTDNTGTFAATPKSGDKIETFP